MANIPSYHSRVAFRVVLSVGDTVIAENLSLTDISDSVVEIELLHILQSQKSTIINESGPVGIPREASARQIALKSCLSESH